MKRLFSVFLMVYGIGLNGSPVIGKSHIVSITNKTDDIVFMHILFEEPCRKIQVTIGPKATIEKATDCWPIAISWGFQQNEFSYKKFIDNLTNNEQLHILQMAIEDKDGQATITHKPISELQVTIQKQLQKIWPAYF